MGAFGEAFAAFARPLIDQTDGSPGQLKKALSLSQLCYNTALLPADKREEMFAEMRASLAMEADDAEQVDLSARPGSPQSARQGRC